MAFFPGGGDQGAFSQEVGSAEQSSRSLVDGEDGLIGEQLFFDAGDFQMMFDIPLHVFVFESFEVTFTDDAGSQGS